MESLDSLEKNYGISLPKGYRYWTQKNYLNIHKNKEDYLWVHEAEWIQPERIPSRDLWRENIIPGLVPFAFTGAGDNWCWNTQAKTGDSEYEILMCLHDEELGNVYAPSFPSWFYRLCLEYASNLSDDDDEILDARENLLLWGQRLSEIGATDWSVYLTELSDEEIIEYSNPKQMQSIQSLGFITTMDVEQIIAAEMGERYLNTKIKWGWYD